MARKKATTVPAKTIAQDVPADPENQNADRAEWARAAVKEFQKQTGLDDADGLDTAVMDLIADLAHLCDYDESLGSFEGLIARAKRHYDEETLPEDGDTRPQGTQFDFYDEDLCGDQR